MTANFYLHNRNAKNRTLIFLHFRYPKNNLFVFSTKQKIEPRFWNFKKKRAKELKSKPHFVSLNSMLTKIENDIISIYQDCISKGMSVSNGDLRQALRKSLNFENSTGKLAHNSGLSFLDYFDLFISESEQQTRLQKNGSIINPTTINNYKAVRKHLYDIQKLKKFRFRLPIISNKSDHELTEIKNYYKKFYRAYTDYLYNDLDCFDNTVGKRIKLLRTVFNYIIEEKGLNLGNYHKTEFYIPSERVPIVVISPEQLNYLIYDEKFNSSLPANLLRARDIFVFGCTVALRVSDILGLTSSNIEKENGHLYLTVKSKKTKTETRVKLPQYAIDIVNRNAAKKLSTIFGKPTLNRLNTELRELAKYCNWNKPIVKTRTKRGKEVTIYKDPEKKTHHTLSDLISSHTMRRTAITISLMLGMPEHAVKELSGHSSTSPEFYRYVKLSQSYMDDKYDDVVKKLKDAR